MKAILVALLVCITFNVQASPPKIQKSKFYDFGEQVIDGAIHKPQFLYTNARQRVRFERLLRLKKSFLPRLYDTANSRIFK